MLLGIRWGSLRAKIIAWSFVPTAIILVVVALVAFYAYQQVSETLAIERDQALAYLIEGSYKIALIARDEAEDGDCQVSNCEELLKNANAELGKAIDDSKQNNYVYIFNHLTNAWKFAANILGANLKKATADDEAGDDSDGKNIPTVYSLGQNYPNPFNPTTRIDFQLPEKKYVSLKIYDVQGNLVTTLVSEELDAGYHSAYWNAGGLASGVYFYHFVSGSYIATKRLLLLK